MASPASGGRCPLAAIVINYRTPDLTVECLASLESQRADGLRAVVVDNCSGDDSVPRLREAIAAHGWDAWVDLVASPVNTGFSGGNNLGLRHVDADAYLLINSDARLLDGALAELSAALREAPDAGLISPRLLLPDGGLHHSCYRFHTPLTSFLRSASTGLLDRLLARHVPTLPHPDTPSEAEWTSFACVLVRREVVDQVGEMDEGYFMYFEDQDYCRRARAQGFRVLNWPNARAVHARGASGRVRQSLARRERPPLYYYASRARYLARFYGIAGLWLSNLLWHAGHAIALVRRMAGKERSPLAQREALDIWTNCIQPMRAPKLQETGRADRA